MHRSTSGARRACAVGTTIALIGLTTGLGLVTATSAYADEPTQAVSASADPTAPDATAPVTTPGDGSTTPATGEPTTPVSTAPAAPVTEPAEPTAPATTAPATAPTKKSARGFVAPAETAATIVGKPKVGETLRADVSFAGPYSYAWSLDDGPTVSELSSFPVTADHIGKTITVVVTGADGARGVATTDPITEDVAFGDHETDADFPLAIDVTAGDELSKSFAVTAGSGDVTYSVGYTNPEWADPTDPDDAPETYLPEGIELDSKTGLLHGTSYYSTVSDFTIVASNGTSTATEYVEVTVEAGEAVGVMATAADQSSEDLFSGDADSNVWIIESDGSVFGIHQPADLDAEPTFTEGEQPMVDQGKSLWIDGSPVDQYGNSTIDPDTDLDEYPVPTVTSDHATDQIAFDEDDLTTKVTFPHASTHVLTVAEDGLSVSFAVTVNPTVPATTVAAVTPTAVKGQLAYTGTDSTGALPWALAMLAAGAGLVGLRALRRRTQR